MKTSAEKLRERADEYITDGVNSSQDLYAEACFVRAAIYSVGAEIIESMPDEEERLRLAILTGHFADPAFSKHTTAELYDEAAEQARAILAEREGGER